MMVRAFPSVLVIFQAALCAFGAEHPLKTRLEKMKPVKPDELRLEPLFQTVAVTWGSTNVGPVAIECRRTDGAWTAAECPARHFAEVDNYRGMAWNLSEGADYVLRLVANGVTVAEGSFSTWSTEVKVAKTVRLERNGDRPLI